MKKQKLVLLIFSIFFFSARVYCTDSSEPKKWIIAAEKFSYVKTQGKAAVSDSTAEMLPQRILENTSARLERHIPPTEEFSRLYYESIKERQSLFLQLSSAIKKRDSLVLGNYTDAELKKKIAAQQENIQEIYTKIDENINNLEQQRSELLSGNKPLEQKKVSEDISLFKFFRNIFAAPEKTMPVEKIAFYKDDAFSLYSPPSSVKEKGYEAPEFEKEAVSAGINALLTGTITSYGNYLLVTAEVWSYPGAKKLGSVSEVGSLSDAGFIASGIAYQLVPVLTNSMPVKLSFGVEPLELKSATSMYVDDTFYTEIPDDIVLDSGIHTVQFMAEGYRTISTSYYFEGNQSYNIQALMENEVPGEILLDFKRPLEGNLFAAGNFVDDIESFVPDGNVDAVSNTARIRVNGKSILGQFIDKDKHTAFFYVPENLLQGTDVLSLKNNPYGNIFAADINPFDRGEYIEKRRRLMYGSYASLVVSLIPYFIMKGNVDAYKKFNGNLSDSAELEYQVWNTVYSVYRWIPLAAGALFSYEFVRYLLAANSVLPVNARKIKNADSSYIYTKPAATEKELTEKELTDKQSVEEKSSEKSSLENASSESEGGVKSEGGKK